MTLSPARQQHKLAEQTSQAKKVFEAIPINENWGLVKIGGEIKRLYGTNVDMVSLQGTVRHLIGAGLVREYADGYCREPIRDIARAAENKPIRPRAGVIKPAPMLPPTDRSTPTLAPATEQIKEQNMAEQQAAPTTATSGVGSMLSAMGDQLRSLSAQLATMAEEVEVIVDLIEDEQAGLRSKLASMDRQVQAAKQLQAAMAGFAAATIN